MENKVFIYATIFIRPNGKKSQEKILNVYPEDAKYINDNKVKVSMEDIGSDYCLWFDDGHKNEDQEPDEIIILSRARLYCDCIKEGVQQLRLRNGE